MALADKPPTLDCQIISPERVAFSSSVEMVVVPAAKGALGILPGHAPLVSQLQPGVVEIYQKDQVIERIFVSGGFAHIAETNCTVLSEEVICLADILPEEVEAYIERIQTQLAEQSLDQQDRATLEENLIVSRAKMELWRQLKGK